MSAFLRILIGLVFGVLSTMALVPALAAIQTEGSSSGTILSLAIIFVVTLLCFFAPTIRRAIGRAFLILGACCLFLPISAMMLSGRAANEVITNTAAADQGMAAVGAGLGAVAITGLATFIGLIMGSIFVILGLVLALGGRREVIVVERHR